VDFAQTYYGDGVRIKVEAKTNCCIYCYRGYGFNSLSHVDDPWAVAKFRELIGREGLIIGEKSINQFPWLFDVLVGVSVLQAPKGCGEVPTVTLGVYSS
jgi:hypothetical protein